MYDSEIQETTTVWAVRGDKQGKPLGKCLLGRPRQDNIKVELMEPNYENETGSGSCPAAGFRNICV
jgi:hypothetical protein